jgi:uncharacterized protein (TIGR02391 family)
MQSLSIMDPTYLTMLCDVLGGDNALLDAEIHALLIEANIDDVNPGINRRKRLFNALVAKQEQDQSAENVVKFINTVTRHMKSSRSKPYFEVFRDELNSALAFWGFMVDEKGDMSAVDVNKVTQKAMDITERVKTFRYIMTRRNLHPDVLSACNRDFLTEENYYPVVRKGVRIMADKLTMKAGLPSVGPEIADQAFSMAWQGWPILAMNDLKTPEEVTQQYAIMHLMRGVLLMFYDERTRQERPGWLMSQQEALELLGIVSFCCTKIDASVQKAAPR